MLAVNGSAWLACHRPQATNTPALYEQTVAEGGDARGRGGVGSGAAADHTPAAATGEVVYASGPPVRLAPAVNEADIYSQPTGRQTNTAQQQRGRQGSVYGGFGGDTAADTDV